MNKRKIERIEFKAIIPFHTVCKDNSLKEYSMDTLKAISTRRSIRKYQPDPISDETINKLLEAGMNAPSALDQQPWHFLVIRDKETLAQMPEHHSHCDLVAQAPACIILCCDKKLEKLPGFWVQDCSACAQNILLAAHSLGLGAVWVGVYPTQKDVASLQARFGLSESIIPFCMIAVGKPDEPYPEKQNFKEDRIHLEKW